MRYLKLLRQGIRFIRERGVDAVLEPQIATTIPEITPFGVRPAATGPARLNLLLPSINPEHYFGGAHTAMQLYRSLFDRFTHSRIVLFDSNPRAEALARFPDHALVSCDEERPDVPRQIVAFNDRYGRTVPVGAQDRWMATAWWTAHAAQASSAWQEAQGFGRRSIFYFIQDFEPGFYPWSSQWAAAMATYRPSEDFAVFNTKLLRDYFVQQGLDYANQAVIEPTLNEGLRPAEAAGDTRDRVVLVYARPSVPRNALPLICEGLREWGWKDARCRQWQVLGIGELDRDLDLGPFVLRGLGKLTLAEYRDRLQRSAVGVSLMLSPHPSYPPLEMAAFGMSTITNAFANKNLALAFPNVRALAAPSPASLADALRQEVDRWEAGGMSQAWPAVDGGHPFCGGNDGLANAARLAGEWLARVG